MFHKTMGRYGAKMQRFLLSNPHSFGRGIYALKLP